ncbi:MAG: phosphoribosyl-ATP diphosphatase, partial [Methanobacteriota archaeon]
SRQKLWQKGETSGHFQEIIHFRPDCDNDTLLVTVKQKDVACHTGKYSCFDEKAFLLEDVYNIIQERFSNPVPGSYTATLTPDKTAQKILEEAGEVVHFTDRDNLIWEIADLLYFISVYMVQNGIHWKDVLLELRKRRFK